VNPGEVPNYRNTAGLPNQNSGRFVSEGTLNNNAGVQMRPAVPLDGNAGGLPEVIVPNPETQIDLHRVSGVNPPF
jgi:hypothetical protein